MLYPVPAVMVTCKRENEKTNILTVAWVGTCCTNPPMLYISVRPERYSYDIIKDTKEFVVNLVTEDLVKACDYCGVKSGKNTDKMKDLDLHESLSEHINCPGLEESPVNIECKVREILPLGSHHMFIADVVGVDIDPKLLDENNKFCLNDAKLITYSHGEYYSLKDCLGTFGYSVRKKK